MMLVPAYSESSQINTTFFLCVCLIPTATILECSEEEGNYDPEHSLFSLFMMITLNFPAFMWCRKVMQLTCSAAETWTISWGGFVGKSCYFYTLKKMGEHRFQEIYGIKIVMWGMPLLWCFFVYVWLGNLITECIILYYISSICHLNWTNVHTSNSIRA